MVYCHGSFAFASCQTCGKTYDGREIEDDIRLGKVPICTLCVKDQGISEVPFAPTLALALALAPAVDRFFDDDDDDDDDDDVAVAVAVVVVVVVVVAVETHLTTCAHSHTARKSEM